MMGGAVAGEMALAVDAAAAMVPGVAVAAGAKGPVADAAAGTAEPVVDVARALAEQYCLTNPAA